MADPITAAIAWLGSSIGGLTGATLIMNAGFLANATLFTVTVAGSAAMQRRAKAKARAAYNASLKDREITFRSAIAPRRVIYGRDRVGGPMVFAQTTGSKSQYLHIVIALAAHECDAIEEVWFGDVLLPEPDASGWITSGPFGTEKVNRGTLTAVVSDSGTITLPQAATRITDITRSATMSVDAATFTGTHTAGSATVSDLPPGDTLTVGYEYGTAAQKVRVRKYLGAAGQTADADLVAASGGKWTSAHKGAGICYLYLMLEYDQEMFANFDLSRVTAVVRGKKVLDPRTATTAWTDNAALAAADWLQDSTYGMRASAAEVPSAEVIAAANICDELVTLDALGATQARYTFNGSFTTDQAPRDVLEDMLSSMAGHCVWTQGRWLLRPGAYRTPAAGAEITEDHLADGGVTVTPKVSRSALFNAVRVTYRDPAQGWAEVQAPLVANATYTAQDGGVQVVRDITMPGSMDALRAQRLGKIELERGRQAVTVQASTNLRAYDYAPTDTTLLILSRYGWGAGKVFEVIDRTWSPEGVLRYTWRETLADVYAWNYGEATVVDPAPDTALPSPYTRPAELGGLTLASGTAQLWRQADGAIISRVLAQWAPSADQFVREGGQIELQWQVAGSSDWQDVPTMPGDATLAWVAPVPDGRVVVVRVRQSRLGVRSDWTYGSVVVIGKTERPANVDNFTVIESPGFGRTFYWDFGAVTPDLAGFEARYVDSAVTVGWEAMTPLFEAARLDRSFSGQVPGDGEWTIGIKAFDTSGNESADAAYITGLFDQGAFGLPLLAVDAGALGWPGTKTGCAAVSYYLADVGTLTWDTIPTAWDSWADWDGPSASPIVYEHTAVDAGSTLTLRLRAGHVASGTVTTQYQSSTDGISYTAWAAVPSGTFSARYVRVRWSIAGAAPILYRARFTLYS